MQLMKVAITGPESTGKNTLSEQLARHYHTEWCPEYAREYLLKHGKKYSYDDLLVIAKEQIEMEKEFESRVKRKNSGISGKQLLFVDTEMYVMKVWCEFVFNKCHKYVLDQIAERKYDLYLLCNIDLPWVKDELREYPDLETRRKLYSIYKDIMINQSVPWADISGDHDQRLKKAIKAVDRLLSK